MRFFERLPMERIAYVHMGGGSRTRPTASTTTPTRHAMPDGAIELLEELVAAPSG